MPRWALFGDAIALVILAPILNIALYALLQFSTVPAPLFISFSLQPANLIYSAISSIITGCVSYYLVAIYSEAPPAGWLTFPSTAIAISNLVTSGRAAES